MTQPLRRWAVLAAVAGLWVVVGGLSRAQDPVSPEPGAPGKNKAEEATGVIVRVDAVPRQKAAEKDADTASKDEPGKEPRRRRPVRLTINTAAVWRDYVRDQATSPENAASSPAAAAAKGAQSVATKGEPRTESTLLTVDVGRNTQIQQRYRSSTDEASLGATTPEAAGKAESADAEPKGRSKRTERPEGETVAIDDLKPGLFVQIEFRRREDRNRAVRLTILRPVGGPDTPAAK